MKKQFYLVFGLLFMFVISTAQKCEPMEIKDAKAEVKMQIKSRGAYQYYLHVKTPKGKMKLMPVDLKDEFKKEGLKLKISGVIQEEFTMIYKPGPTNVPEEDFEIKNIELSTVKLRE